MTDRSKAAHHARMALALALSEALQKAELSQRQLARKAGASEARVSRILSSRSNPTIGTVANLADAMGFELRFVFSQTKEKKNGH